MKILANILISAIFGMIATMGAYNYLPLSFIEKLGPKIERPFGATITTIQGTDTLKDSRAVINTNFSNLNSDKIENSSSSIAAIITLSNLTTVGALVSGSLASGFTPVVVARGGTGSTTLSNNQVLVGSGTGIVQTVTGFGSSGQLLTSNGNGSPPSWQTPSVDLTVGYTWTGQHIFWNKAVGIGTSTPALGNNGLSNASSTYIVGGLGVGIATTTNSNVEVKGDTYIQGACNGCYTLSTASNDGVLGTSNGSLTTVTASCPAGASVVGGGYRRNINSAGVAHWIAYENNATSSFTAWAVSMSCVASPCDSNIRLFVDVTCIAP